ncbi:carbohydrate binding family 9 domain-containing protein [candidate division TA06 bacterium]|uniref:Carbohydrate binding family 9 domain-containing protein n=1 Tax=candidate division TA06 bacterium TaxID=2250710 RepID=A0A933IAF4_UNCT6|nr:carbohydrate binding family 9 domain-containing protein [candidate division TA06 bacterium]
MDICWDSLPSASGFIQKTPKEGQPSIESTAVKICYDRKYLYFALYCQDKHPDKISSRLIPREEGDYGDIVIILLDTYNDKRGAYKLFINPKGIQGDAYLSEDGANSDLSWNGVWSSAVKIDTSGWTAELAIPFKNLRFADGENQTWGINFGRYIALNNEVSYWQPVTKQEGYPRISKCGKLCGLSGIKPGRNLEILPYGLGRTEKYSNQRISAGKLGLDAKWAPTTNMAWDITINPDFAQIEADPQNINLSSANFMGKQADR